MRIGHGRFRAENIGDDSEPKTIVKVQERVRRVDDALFADGCRQFHTEDRGFHSSDRQVSGTTEVPP